MCVPELMVLVQGAATGVTEISDALGVLERDGSMLDKVRVTKYG